jgi:predicted nucleic acid-binding Zn ribbon protein
MPNYVYQSLADPDKRFDLSHSLHDKALETHPETGEPIRRIIVPGATIRRTGLKKSTKVNKKSPAATACGCASMSALESLGMA